MIDFDERSEQSILVLLSVPVGVFRRSASPVVSLSSLGENKLLASTGESPTEILCRHRYYILVTASIVLKYFPSVYFHR